MLDTYHRSFWVTILDIMSDFWHWFVITKFLELVIQWHWNTVIIIIFDYQNQVVKYNRLHYYPHPYHCIVLYNSWSNISQTYFPQIFRVCWTNVILWYLVAWEYQRETLICLHVFQGIFLDFNVLLLRKEYSSILMVIQYVLIFMEFTILDYRV